MVDPIIGLDLNLLTRTEECVISEWLYEGHKISTCQIMI